jgi:hypothetical protein
MTEVKVNLACARFPAAGWINTDVRQYPHVDVLCDVRRLPFGDESVDRVYCGHLLEHLRESDVSCALKEISRVMRDGAELMVVGPCIDKARALDPHNHELHRSILSGVTGWEEQQADPLDGDVHHWESTTSRTLTHVRYVFYDADEVDESDVDDTWPVVSRGHVWQFFVRARKHKWAEL